MLPNFTYARKLNRSPTEMLSVAWKIKPKHSLIATRRCGTRENFWRIEEAPMPERYV